jgi:transcriptional regulator with XRE-family HTH domain
LRESAGLTQQQLAERASLTREGVAQLETGRREPALATLIALCKALGVSCDSLLAKPAGTTAPKRGRPRKSAEDVPAGDATAGLAAPKKLRRRKNER